MVVGGGGRVLGMVEGGWRDDEFVGGRKPFYIRQLAVDLVQ